VTVAFFVLGSSLAGGLMGLVAGALGNVAGVGSISPSLRLLALAAAAALGAALDMRLAGLRLPGTSRQVNEDWLHRYRSWVYGLGFGFQLGLGLVTVVSASAIYLAFLASLLSASPAAGAAIGGAFGLLRSVVLFAAGGARSPSALLRLADRLARFDAPVRMLAVASQSALALAALVWAVS
jgi:hypothetical protein